MSRVRLNRHRIVGLIGIGVSVLLFLLVSARVTHR